MMTEVHAYLPHVDDGSDKTNLWASALEKLSEADREKIVFEGQNQLDVLSQLQKLTDNAKDQCIKKRWRLTHNGKTIVLRDLFSKITVWIDTFKQIGDNAVQYDPGHAALPWAGIRFLLQVRGD